MGSHKFCYVQQSIKSRSGSANNTDVAEMLQGFITKGQIAPERWSLTQWVDIVNDYNNNKRAMMALDRSPEL